VYAAPAGTLPRGGGAARLKDRQGWTAFAAGSVARGAVTLLLGLLVWSQVPALLGWETTVVMSGSMAPAVAAGDVVVARPLGDATARVGQVLLVDDPDRPGESRLHRLVALEDGGLRLQGDANATPDSSLVAASAVRGAGVLRIPAVGLPVLWSAQHRWVPLAATSGALAALLAAASWHRVPAGAPGPARSRVPLRARWRTLRARGRHAGTPSRRTARLRRAVAIGVLVALSPVLLEHATPAGATFSAPTTNTGNTFTTDEVLSWGCIDESAAPAARFYALRETTGTTAYNTGALATPGGATNGNGTFRGGVTLGTAGPDCGHGVTRAVTLDGSTGWMSTSRSTAALDTFTTQVWFRTATPGGRLFGLNSQETAPGQYDRHVYMSDNGALVLGVFQTTFHTVTSPAGTSYADDRWHLVTATLGGTGMHLYVDGVEVAADTTQTAGEPYASGFWRFGWGDLGTWPGKPTNPYFTGAMASAAVFDRELTPAEVARQYRPVG